MNRSKEIVKYSIWGILVNIFLVSIKAIVGLIARSITVVLDAVNNLTDALSSIITIVGVKLSNKKPDKNHPYGHGRIEYLTSLIIGIIILVSGIASLYESIQKIITPTLPNYQLYSLIIIVIGIFVKLFFGLFIRKKGTSLNSNSLKASGIDAINDAALSLSVFVGALISYVWQISIEGYLGVIISIIILKAAYTILKDGINDVIGARASVADIERLKEVISSNPQVLGVYDIIMHNYGPNKTIATAHIQVEDNLTAKKIHEITRLIQVDVYQKLNITLTIGIYASNDDEEYQDIKKMIISMMEEVPTIKQMHGFYVNEDLKLITFDLIFSFEETKTKEIIDQFINKLKDHFPKYQFHIIIDTDYSL